MMQYWEIFKNGYSGYANYLWNDITNPSLGSYFYWLILISLFFFALEVIAPWRKGQKILRKDFWLDAFYMFFNFFLFSLIVYNAASDVIVSFFNGIIEGVSGFDLQASNPLRSFPMWAILIIGFIVRDFVQWWVHRLLHRSEFLWQFHKVHHSVQEMGFAAHLRYHWMETIVYRSIEYIPLALLGIGLYDFFIIHLFTLAWGHYNHANISNHPKITGGILGGLIGIAFVGGLADITVLNSYGPSTKFIFFIGFVLLGVFVLSKTLKYVFNSPELHIWHHAEHLPESTPYGVNFAITLAAWDYLFNTAYLPKSGRDIKLGFEGVEHFPQGFIEQNLNGIIKSHH
jgi:sterol desaturase/sphingolipid hydroxylase (fatty acid hydroxylase superfamily)